jgi:YHS domain-containing protein
MLSDAKPKRQVRCSTIRQVVVIAALLLGGSAAFAEPPLPQISETGVFSTDVVAAAQGNPIPGTPALAVRNQTIVHYLASKEHQDRFVANRNAYPEVEPGVSLALMGADPVLRFPNGVHDAAIGAIVAGNPTRYVAEHKGAWYAFATEATLNAFKSDPERYIPDVGGYCLGAMSRRGITPGDPRNIFFVPEGGKWAVYGRPNGPKAWAEMTTFDRVKAIETAHAFYRERISPISK